MCECVSSSCRGFKHHCKLQQHPPVVVMATARRRSGRARRHSVDQRHRLLGEDASSRRHRGCRRSADSWLSLSGRGDVTERQTDKPIRNQRQDRCDVIVVSFFSFSSFVLNRLCLIFSAGSSDPPLLVSLLLLRAPPVVGASSWSLGHLQGAAL